MSYGIIICSRMNSTRIPEKPMADINGIPMIAHLMKRLQEFPIYLAIGDYRTFKDYLKLKTRYNLGCMIYMGYPKNPLQRMYQCAKIHEIDTVIRVTHDKIFVDPKTIETGIKIFQNRKLDYLYSSFLIDGTGFEIISFRALKKAALKFENKNIEHISYAIRAVTDKIFNAKILAKSQPKDCKPRLLVDHPDDLTVMRSIFNYVGNNCTLKKALEYLARNSHIEKINRLPQITVYTCAYNAEQFIMKCVDSVINQHFPKSEMEYIIIDDKSTDKTYSILCHEYERRYDFIKIIRNKENIGLASSSNIALSKAKGEFIMRLDADDYFVDNFILDSYINFFENSKADVLYPAYYNGNKENIIQGDLNHHIGGAIFRTKAINAVKFTDKLRGYEGLDFFERAKEILDIDYYREPVFFYRQHENQLTKNNLEERQKIKKKIEKGITGEKLCQ